MILIDAHCHLEPRDFPEVGPLIERARASGVVHAVVVGQFHRAGDFGSALELAAAHRSFLTPTMGVHPHDAAKVREEDRKQLEALCARPEVAAVGEAGLDYFYEHSPREAQREVFRWQCRLARELSKPLVVHVRDAHEECQQILQEEGVRSGMIHCFTGDAAAAQRYLALGFHVSISGIVTYKKTEGLQAAVKMLPLERLLVETDSPFLAPIPHRGKTNEPSLMVHTVTKIAELKGLAPDQVALAAAHNVSRLLSLKVPLPQALT